MNKFTFLSKHLRTTTPWIAAMKEREAKKTPTYEMTQRMIQSTEPYEMKPSQSIQPVFVRVSNGVTQRIEDIKADLADLPWQPALA